MINEMLDKLLKVLNDVLNEFSEKYNFYENLKVSDDIAILKHDLKKLSHTVFSKNSKLLLLNHIVIEFNKNCSDVMYNYYTHESRDALGKYPFKYFIWNRWQEHIDSLPDDFYSKNIAYAYEAEYSPSEVKLKYYLLEIEKTNSIDVLKNICSEIITRYARDIDMIAYSNFRIRDPNNRISENSNTYNASDNYLQKWINGEITLDLWRKFPDTMFLLSIEIFYGIEYLEKVNINQLILYNKALDIELNSLKKYILDSSPIAQILNIERQLNIIQKFLSGEFTPLDFQRISNIIKFDRPDEVILAYDDLHRFEIYDYSKILPYDGVNLRKSPRFVAELLNNYVTFLREHLSILKNQKTKVNSNEKIVKPKPNSFGIKNPKNIPILKTVLQELQFKYELIQNEENKIDDLVDILTAGDYSTIPYKIKIGCQTNIFSYIIKGLKPCFNSLSAHKIEHTGKFYTLENDILLTATNFNKSSTKVDTLQKEEIDKILIKLKK